MNPWQIYDALLETASSEAELTDMVLGINWSLASFYGHNQPGICFSATSVTRTLPWSGSLLGKSLNELKHWVKHWEPAAASVGLLAINSYFNSRSGLLLASDNLGQLLSHVPANLSVFEYFREATLGAKVGVIGSYPGLKEEAIFDNWVCIERTPRPGELPDPASYYELPTCDWVFITGASLANKSLPLLLDLSRNAQVVLMGPSVPWTDLWRDFGVNYLAGVNVVDSLGAALVASQAGGTQLFDGPVDYHLVAL